jgi:hypothetical protein
MQCQDLPCHGNSAKQPLYTPTLQKTYINITDRDVRDMYYDARVTGRANK